MRKLLLAMVFILLTGAMASSLSVSSVSIASTVTSGSSFSISATLSADDVASTSVTLGGSPLDSALTCTPTASQTVSTSSGSGTATWSCTANTIGVYNNQLTISASGVDGTGVTKTASTLTGTEVVAGAGSPALTVNAILYGDSCTCCSGNWVAATVVVSNSGNADAESVSLSWHPSASTFPSFSCPGNETGTLPSGQTRTIACTSERVTFTGTRNIDFWINGTGVSDSSGLLSASVNVNTSCPPSTDPVTDPVTEGPMAAPSPTWTISLSPSSATLNPGQSKTVSVDVKNTGTLQASGVVVSSSSTCASITPSSFNLGNVAGGSEVSYSAKITLSPSAVKGAKCYVDFTASPTSGASRTTSFAITVPGGASDTVTTTAEREEGEDLPPATRDDAIEAIDALNLTIAEVEAKIDSASGSNVNITDASDKLNQAKDLFEKAKAAMESGDYDAAVRHALEAKTLLNQAALATTPVEKYMVADTSTLVSTITRVIMALVALSAVLGGVYYVAPKLAQEISKKAKGGFKFSTKDQGKQLDLLMTEIKDKVVKDKKKGKNK